MKTIGLALAAAAALFATPAAAEDFTGPRVGATVGVAGGDLGDRDLTTYGVNVGYDLKVAPGLIVGATAEYQRDTDGDVRDLAVSGRVGTPLSSNVLVYATGGYTNIAAGAVDLNGYRVGGGVEVALGGGLSLGVEQRYADYDGLTGYQTVAGLNLRF